ncbi:MAG: ABC transporter permease [Promethearchaeota archaeon]
MAEIFEDAKTRFLRISAMVIKEFKSLLQVKSTILILFLVPLSIIPVLATTKISTDRFVPTIWIIDYDNSEQSEQFIATMKNSSGLEGLIELSNIVYASGDLAPIEPAFLEREAFGEVSEDLAQKTIPTKFLDAYIILQDGFQDSLAENGTVELIIYFDAIDFISLVTSEMTILVSLTNIQIQNMLFERDIYYYPELRPDQSRLGLLSLTASLIIPLLGLFTMLLITSQSIVGDIPLKRMLNTSLRRGEVVVGKVVSYSILALFQVLLTLLLLTHFEISINCLWIELFFILLVNSIVGVCMGIFISTITHTKLQASQLFLMVFFILFIFQYFTRAFLDFIPLEQTKIAYEALANRGMSLLDPIVLNSLFKLTLNGIFYFLFSVIYIKYFKKRFV